jgi:hypothetical protein
MKKQIKHRYIIVDEQEKIVQKCRFKAFADSELTRLNASRFGAKFTVKPIKEPIKEQHEQQ